MNRLARMMALTLGLLCLFTIGAGAAVARLLPSRLAMFDMPRVSGRGLARSGAAMRGATGAHSGSVATPAGVSASVDGLIRSGGLGPHVGALVTDLSTGRVLYELNPAVGVTPASTTKIATAIAALDTLGPNARFTTTVTISARTSAGTSAGAGGSGSKPAGGAPRIVLLGGGDPTLAAGRPPATDYPRPATLAALAAATARSLRAEQITSVRLGYDASLYTGPPMAVGWKPSYVTTGDVTPVTALEVDQGRLTPLGVPEDADDPANYLPRSQNSAADAVHAFASFLAADGIHVRGPQRPEQAASGATELAQVRSPPLADLVEWMLLESNNDIAEGLARQVAIATGRRATFGAGAAAVRATLRRLGVAGGIQTMDGSGLSADDRISPVTLTRLISLVTSPRRPQLRPIISGLPVAGFSGTLSAAEKRFDTKLSAPAAGLVRAKTGTLDNVRALAGLVVDSDGRTLAFAFMIDHVPTAAMTLSASVLDRLAAALARCGCR